MDLKRVEAISMGFRAFVIIVVVVLDIEGRETGALNERYSF